MSPGAIRWTLFGGVLMLSGVLIAGAFNPAPHSGGDNSTYVSLAHSLVSTGTYTERFDPAGLPHTKYPPVFPLILAALIALGARTWVAIKSVAVVSTLLAVGLTYLWTERRLGAMSAFLLATLLAASSAVVYYSHWELSDPVFVAFTVAAFWALDGGVHGARGEMLDLRWLALGVLFAGLAYFTRSAGLPLIVAVLGWLFLQGRLRTLAVVGVALAVPAVGWWLRGRGAPGSYAIEFWMVDPYQPALGTIGVTDLIPRAIENLEGYVTRHGPGGIIGPGEALVPMLGIALTATTLWGWFRTVRQRVGPAELFLPLYLGLILVWPVVWSGDRFALPLYPLIFSYSAVALRDVTNRAPPFVTGPVVALAMLLVLLPAGRTWLGTMRESRACARIISAEGPWGCYGPGVGAFVEAAQWAGGALPDGAAVMTRKPTHFYVLSGVPSRTFPFTPSPETQLATADSLGVQYLLIDEWDALASVNVGGAVVRQPGSFCFVRAFGQPGQGGAQLLGILPAAQRSTERPAEGAQTRIALCPASYTVQNPVAYSPSSSGSIPLLDGLDP